jgi:hypothetical protein
MPGRCRCHGARGAPLGVALGLRLADELGRETVIGSSVQPTEAAAGETTPSFTWFWTQPEAGARGRRDLAEERTRRHGPSNEATSLAIRTYTEAAEVEQDSEPCRSDSTGGADGDLTGTAADLIAIAPVGDSFTYKETLGPA